MEPIKVSLDKFYARDYQLPVFEALFEKKYKKLVVIWPRRAGKDMVGFNIIIEAALFERIGTYYYVFPTFSAGRRILWDAITNDGSRVLDFIPREVIESTHEQQMRIKLINGSVIQIIGSDNYDNTLIGTNPIGMIFSEYALQDPQAYAMSKPILAGNDGWCLFLSTPRAKNHLYSLWQIAIQNPDHWFCNMLTVKDTKHISEDEIQAEIDRGEISWDLAQQEYYCFPGDQEVMKSDCLARINEIKVNDLIISHAGRLRKVLGVSQREYEGKLIHIYTYGTYEPIICTPNHPVLTYNKPDQSYSWKEAQYINKEDRLVFPKLTLGKIPLISYELCMLLAWYITEGSSGQNHIQFTVGKISEIERISELLLYLNIEYHVRQSETAFNVIVNSVQLVDFLKTNCGTEASNKRIPLWLIGSYEEKFFHELIKGDGCVSRSRTDTYPQLRYIYTTVSKTLAYQVQLLANSLPSGLTAGITRKCSEKQVMMPCGKRYDTKDSYAVQIHEKVSDRGKEIWLARAKNGVCARIKRIESSDYSGKVYNLKVQFDESYTIRGRSVHNCSFDMGVSGSVYGTSLDRMKLNNQITNVPWQPPYKVNTAWDIGNDMTSIIFYQLVGLTVNVIDYYENTGQNLEHYVNILNSRSYTYGKHYFPHDMRITEWGGKKYTRVEKARQLGVKADIVDSVSIEDGIEYVKSSMSKIWIDANKCSKLVSALENYRYEYDRKLARYKEKPLHDKFSHGSDSFRYMCLSLPKSKDSMTQEDVDRVRREALYSDKTELAAVFQQPNHGPWF